MWLYQIQVTAGALDDQGVRVNLIVFTAESPVVEEPQVNAATGAFIEPRRERDLITRGDATFFGMGLIKRGPYRGS